MNKNKIINIDSLRKNKLKKNNSYIYRYKFKITNIYKIIVSYKTYLLLLWILNICIAHATNFFSITAADTIAGYSTIAQTSKIDPGINVNFVLSKPDGSNEYLNAISDNNGIATVTISGNKLQKSGIYTITANAKGYVIDKPSTFEVKHNNVSIYNSKITISKNNLISDGVDKAIISVLLKDDYNNPIPNHKIILISQDKNIIINPLYEKTDENGIWQASLSSKYPSNTYIEAVDLTSNKVLAQKVNVSFTKNNINNTYNNKIYNYNNLLDKYLYTDISNISNTLPNSSGIKLILDGPTTIEVNKDFTIKVRIIDDQNKILSGYNGTITFNSSDPLASLPSDFTFTSEDRGMRVFSLSARLKTPGIQTITVSDKNNKNIQSGELKINVLQYGQSDNTKPIITEPKNDTIINSKSINIKGNIGSGGILSAVILKLYDNDKLVKEFKTDSEGLFDETINDLSEGQHILKVVKKSNDNEIESDPITIYADFTAPSYFGDISINPKSGYPGDIVTVQLISEPDLASSKLFINNKVYEFLPEGIPNNNKQIYKSDIQLPENHGEYTIDIELIDKAGNSNLYENVAKIIVYPKDKTSKYLPINSDYIFKCGSLFIYFAPIQNAKYYKVFQDKKIDVDENNPSENIYQLSGDAHVQYEIKNINLSEPLYIKILAYDINNNVIAVDNYQIIDHPDKHAICDEDTIKTESINTPPTGPNTYIILLIIVLISLVFYKINIKFK